MRRFLVARFGACLRRACDIHFRELAELPGQVVETIVELGEALIHRRTIVCDGRQGEARGQRVRALTGLLVAGLPVFLGATLMAGAGEGVGTPTLPILGGRIAVLGSRQRVGASKGVGTLTRLISGRGGVIHRSEWRRAVVVGGCPT